MTAKADAPALDLATLKALFSETLEEQMAPLREELASLKSKVAATDAMIPKFVPMQNRANPSGMPKSPAEHLAAMAGMRPGDTNSDTARSILTTVNGQPMHQGALKALLDSYAPVFAPGQTVRINPEAARLGWAAGRTWSDLLAKGRTNPDGVGVVREVQKFGPRGWSYRVKIEEHSPERGMNFDQHELLSA